jgi:hypothetical protein
MKQWDKTNPSPAGAAFEDFTYAVFAEMMKTPAKASAEFHALKQLCSRTQEANKLKPLITGKLVDAVNIRAEYDFRLQLRMDDGTVGNTYTMRLPVKMAKALKIPYVATDTSFFMSDLYPSYVEEGDTVEWAALANGSNCNVVCAASTSKAYQAYKKGKRTLQLWQNERQKAREEIADYLNQFNTTGQIRDGWPEMEQYLPAHIADPGRVIKLPALTRSRLNERLGI